MIERERELIEREVRERVRLKHTNRLRVIERERESVESE